MKKSILMLGLAVAAMTSCTNDEVLEQAQPVQKAIGFESFVNKGTRATVDVNKASLKEFYVFGYYGTDSEVFENSIVKGDAENGWDVVEQKLWTKNAYEFAAYANGSGDGIDNTATTDEDQLADVSFATQALTINSYSLDGKDLIAAFASQDNSEGNNQNDVSLTFSHLLSKVRFVYDYTDNGNESLEMTVSNATLKVPTTGKCVAQSETTTWSEHTTTSLTTYTVPGVTNLGLNDEASATSEEYFYVLPTGNSMGDEILLSFDVTYTDKTQNNAVVKTDHHDLKLNTAKLSDNSACTWSANTVYVYTVQLPFAPLYINFTVSDVNGWGAATNATIAPANN